uniref:protein-serine/threonine phosphatase n=1 Tax=Hucho hucho TaxID=62062 RepID=A0A4W5QFS7_9TELE
MLKTRQCLLGIRTFLGVTSRIWGFILYILRKHLRTVIQYQTVRYDTLPLSPISRNRLNAVKRKILVLDLDETLIHSHHDGVLRPTVRPGTPPDFILKVVIDKHPVRFFVHKRPHVDFFLEVVSQWYELVVFTASMEIYGSAVADKLDNNRNILKRRYYRQHCTLDLGSYIKDLSVVHKDLSSIVILDNSPGAYRSHPGEVIHICAHAHRHTHAHTTQMYAYIVMRCLYIILGHICLGELVMIVLNVKMLSYQLLSAYWV